MVIMDMVTTRRNACGASSGKPSLRSRLGGKPISGLWLLGSINTKLMQRQSRNYLVSRKIQSLVFSGGLGAPGLLSESQRMRFLFWMQKEA
ncbi:unnamed protein product [Staurois parvus]|uniref:Uncharacterized protein n=1 Tax=Staurois parvus TaxID=386267 RepID=A0ABN9AP96_9NEOB|nr:unnamed protein product [Staurois parvus]